MRVIDARLSYPGVARARRALLSGEPAHVSDVSILSVLIGGDKAQAVERVASEIGRSPLQMDVADYSSVPELGDVAIGRLAASIEVGRRRVALVAADRPLLTSPCSVIAFCGPQMQAFDREHFWVLALDAKNRLIRPSEVSIGIVDATVVHPREVFKDAVRQSAAGVVVVHNHPSGDPQPSRADLRLTSRLVQAGEVLGIPVLDHVIVGSSGIGYSLREHGELG